MADDFSPSLGLLANQPPPPLDPAQGQMAAGVVPQRAAPEQPVLPSLDFSNAGDFSLEALQQRWQQGAAQPIATMPSLEDIPGFGPSDLAAAGGAMAGIRKLRPAGAGYGGTTHYRLMSEQGKDVGTLESQFHPPDRVHVNYLEAERGKWELGVHNVRSLIAELKREYPEMRTISLDRATGARWGLAADPAKQAAYDQFMGPHLQFRVPERIQAAPAHEWSEKPTAIREQIRQLYERRARVNPSSDVTPQDAPTTHDERLRQFFDLLWRSSGQ